MNFWGELEFDLGELQPSVYVNAMNGKQGLYTMMVDGHLGKKNLHIVINSGSMHNLLDLDLARKCDQKLEPVIVQTITIADGNQLNYQYICRAS